MTQGRKGLFPVTLPGKLGNSRQELGQRPWRSAAYRLASHGLLSLLSYGTEDLLRRWSTAHSGLGPPTAIINTKNVPMDMLTGQPNSGSSSAERPSSRLTLVCVKLTEGNQHGMISTLHLFGP